MQQAAHVIYDDSPDNLPSAMSVKAELTQQMFTKTMVLQVWKPENERPGRHFVYTTLYLRFFVRILVQLSDRANLELLIRRLRRKTHEFFDHTRLWQDTCLAYLKLLRRAGKIPEGFEDTIFKSINHDEFTQRSAKLEIWCHDTNNKSTSMDVLREVIELKKLNNGLMKPTLIDDLLGDTYAKLYQETDLEGVQLPAPDIPTQTLPQQIVPPAAPVNKPMSLTNVMNMDGAADGPMSGSMLAFQTSSNSTPQPTEHVPTKARAKGVGRRELQRKAESCVTRPVTTPAATSLVQSQIPFRSTPSGNHTVQVVIPVSRSSPATGAATAAGPLGTDGRAVAAEGSGNDDADDESGSELSELDEEPEEPTPTAPRTTMFPGLMKSVTGGNTSSLGGESRGGSASAAATPTPAPMPPQASTATNGDEDVKMEE
jgi:hypothetical protein